MGTETNVNIITASDGLAIWYRIMEQNGGNETEDEKNWVMISTWLDFIYFGSNTIYVGWFYLF